VIVNSYDTRLQNGTASFYVFFGLIITKAVTS